MVQHSKINPKNYISVFPAFIILLILAAAAFFFREKTCDICVFFSRRFLLVNQSRYISGIKEAKRKNLSLSIEVAKLKHFKEENQRLRRALQFEEEKKIHLIEADIIGFDPSSWRRAAFINAGKKSGVKEGLLAVNENGSFVGKISEARSSYSTLIFADDPDFTMPVFVGDGFYGLLKGGLRGAKVLYIEIGDNIKEGDKILAKTIFLPFPVEVGVVRKAIKDDEGLFWDVDAQLYTSKARSDDIFIIK